MKRKVISIAGIALIIGFISGAVVIGGFIYPNLKFFENAYNNQEQTYNEITNYTCSQNDLKNYLKEFNTSNSPYRWYLKGTASLACRNGFMAYHTYEETQPTPTPEIKYQTQTVTKTQYLPVNNESPINQIRPCLDANTGEIAPCVPIQ